MDPIESPWTRVITLTIAIMLGLAVPIGMGIAGATSHDVETTEAEDAAGETDASSGEDATEDEAAEDEATDTDTSGEGDVTTTSEEEDAATEESGDLETQSGDVDEEADAETQSSHHEDFNWTRDWVQAAHGLCNAWDASESGRSNGNASRAPPFMWLASEAEAHNESVEDHCAGVEAPHGSHQGNGSAGTASDHASDVATAARENGADGALYAGPPEGVDTAAAPEDEETDAEATTEDETESETDGEDEPGAAGRAIADDARGTDRGAAAAE